MAPKIINPKALGYVRVSSKAQVFNTSPDNQIDQLRAYAQLKNYTDFEVIQEMPFSASKRLEDRPGGKLAWEMIKRKEVGAFIVTTLDRAFRDAEDCLRCVRLWKDYGTRLQILDFAGSTLDVTESIGKFIITVWAGFAEFERNRLLDRVNEGLAFRQKQGRATSGWAPYGYTFGPWLDGDPKPYRQVIPVKEEQAILSTMFELHARGRNCFEIARELDRLNLFRRNGEDWNGKNVQKIMAAARKRGYTGAS